PGWARVGAAKMAGAATRSPASLRTPEMKRPGQAGTNFLEVLPPRWAPRGEKSMAYLVVGVALLRIACGLLLGLGLRLCGLGGLDHLRRRSLLRCSFLRRLLGDLLYRDLLHRSFLGGRLLGRRLLGRRLLGGNLLGGRFLGSGLLGSRFLCSGFLGSGHGSSQLLISWQWLPSKSMQERFNQQVAVRRVPKIVHLSVGAQIRKPSQDMQRNRDSDLANCIGFFTVLDIGLDEFRCRHKTHSP